MKIKRGFTLVENLVIIAILGALAATIFPSLRGRGNIVIQPTESQISDE